MNIPYTYLYIMNEQSVSIQQSGVNPPGRVESTRPKTGDLPVHERPPNSKKDFETMVEFYLANNPFFLFQ